MDSLKQRPSQSNTALRIIGGTKDETPSGTGRLRDLFENLESNAPGELRINPAILPRENLRIFLRPPSSADYVEATEDQLRLLYNGIGENSGEITLSKIELAFRNPSSQPESDQSANETAAIAPITDTPGATVLNANAQQPRRRFVVWIAAIALVIFMITSPVYLLLPSPAHQLQLAQSLVTAESAEKFEECLGRMPWLHSGVIDEFSNILAIEPASTASEQERDNLGKRKAAAAIGLLRLNSGSSAWQILRDAPDPTARSYFIHRLKPFGVDRQVVIDQIRTHKSHDVQAGLWLALGEYEYSEAINLKADLLTAYCQNEAELRSAAEWVAHQWGKEEWLRDSNTQETMSENRRVRLKQVMDQLSKGNVDHPWYVNAIGQTMVVMPDPGTIQVGAPPALADTLLDEQHPQYIGRTFAISATYITIEQCQSLLSDFQVAPNFERHFGGNGRRPAPSMTHYLAARFCNELSKKEELTPCYVLDEQAQTAKPSTGFFTLDGYRLPSAAEAEFSIRAGSITSRFYGESDSLLDHYVHVASPPLENNGTTPVGQFKPNPFGLFDAHGNINCLCEFDVVVQPYRSTLLANIAINIADNIKQGTHPLKGASYTVPNRSSLISAYQFIPNPIVQNPDVGFRVARTLTVSSAANLSQTP